MNEEKSSKFSEYAEAFRVAYPHINPVNVSLVLISECRPVETGPLPFELNCLLLSDDPVEYNASNPKDAVVLMSTSTALKLWYRDDR